MIVLLHGARHGSWCWQRAVAFFKARGLETLTPDFTVHNEATLADFAEEVTAKIPPDAILVGHSLGGAVAQKIVNTTKARALVLVSSVPPGGVLVQDDEHLEKQAPDALKRVRAFLAKQGPFPRELFLSEAADEEAVELVATNLGPASPRAQAELRNPVVKAASAVRTLVFAGEHDAFLPISAHVRTARYHRGALHMLPGGHDLMLEPSAPQLFQMIAELEEA